MRTHMAQLDFLQVTQMKYNTYMHLHLCYILESEITFRKYLISYPDQHSRAQKGLQYQPPVQFGLAGDFCYNFSHQMVLCAFLYISMKTTFHLYIEDVQIAPSSEKILNKNLPPNQTNLEVGTRAPSGLQNAGRRLQIQINRRRLHIVLVQNRQNISAPYHQGQTVQPENGEYIIKWLFRFSFFGHISFSLRFLEPRNMNTNAYLGPYCFIFL